MVLDGKEIDGTTMKFDGKYIPIVVYILTDVLLICQAEKSARIMRELTMIRAPLRTDKIKPIKMESEEKVTLLNITDYGCPDLSSKILYL